MGKEGKILEVDSDGDVVVMVATDLWLFNPAALEDLTGGEATSRQGEVPTGSPGQENVVSSMNFKTLYMYINATEICCALKFCSRNWRAAGHSGSLAHTLRLIAVLLGRFSTALK